MIAPSLPGPHSRTGGPFKARQSRTSSCYRQLIGKKRDWEIRGTLRKSASAATVMAPSIAEQPGYLHTPVDPVRRSLNAETSAQNRPIPIM